jgi:hypothetical protein
MAEAGRQGRYGRLVDAPRNKSGAVAWPRVIVTFRDEDEYAALKAAAEREGIAPAALLRQAFLAWEQPRTTPQPRTEWGLRWADGTIENLSDRYRDEAESVARKILGYQVPANPLTLVKRENGGEWTDAG